MVWVKLKSALSFQCNPEFAEALERELTIENPAYRRAEERRASTASILPEFTVMEYRHGDCWLPRGALGDLSKAVEKRKGRLFLADEGMTCPQVRLFAKCRILSHQAELINRLETRLQGVAIADPTAHVATGVATIAMLSVAALAVTDGVQSRQAWFRRLSQVFGDQVGIADADFVTTSPIACVAMKDLVRLDDTCLQKFHARFGLLIVDDCQNAIRHEWKRVIDASPARYRLGITNAPAPDTDELAMLDVARWRFGEVLGVMPPTNLFESTDLPERAPTPRRR